MLETFKSIVEWLQPLSPAVRARLWVNEIDAIGAALRAGWIDPDEAIAAIADSGCLHLLAPAEERA